jgi:hypothetical protein
VRQIDAQGSVAVLAGKVRSGNTTMRHKVEDREAQGHAEPRQDRVPRSQVACGTGWRFPGAARPRCC